MPITRCPFCGLRMVIANSVLGKLVGCSRCQRTFEAQPQTSASRFGELLLVVAAVAVGAVVTWLILKNR
jgi:transposase-like protein